MRRETRRFLLLVIAMALVAGLEAKGKGRGRSEQDEYWSNYKSFVEDGTEEILSIGTLILLVVYFIYDSKKQNQNGQKQVSSQSLAAPQSPRSPTQFLSSMNQLYLRRQQSSSSSQPRVNSQFPIYKIVITGGPCGGKTTSLDKMKKQMSQKGFRVFSVPQIPTMVVQGGGMIMMNKLSTKQKIHFQVELIRFQMYAQDYFTKLAEMSKTPSIILCDRGAVDPAAYISKAEFQAAMDVQGWNWVVLRDRRYDQVIFLDSAAVGAEEFYTRSNNAARSEGLEAAKALNQKTLDAWLGHPNLSIITNKKGESFDGKINRSLKALQVTVGLQKKADTRQKFLVQQVKFPQNLKIQTSQVQQGFLVNTDPLYQQDRIKRRTINNSSTYQRKYLITKTQQGVEYMQQIRKPLTSLQYVTLKQVALDPAYDMVQYKRIHFAYNSISFQLDIYPSINGEKNVYLLRFDSTGNDQIVNIEELLPKFIKVRKNVKKEDNYKLREILRKK